MNPIQRSKEAGKRDNNEIEKGEGCHISLIRCCLLIIVSDGIRTPTDIIKASVSTLIMQNTTLENRVSSHNICSLNINIQTDISFY